jgi:UMF1 family MFS transporter
VSLITADQKKRFMQFFIIDSRYSCIYFFTGENIEYGIVCSILASIGYAGSLRSTMVFYQRFLPERMDQGSARGFAMGYTGIILLIINLLYQNMPFSVLKALFSHLIWFYSGRRWMDLPKLPFII